MPAVAPARDRLLNAANALFYERGITATGVDAVVAASGVSKPTLYAHFRSKSELLAAVPARRTERRQDSLPAWLAARDGDPRERLLAVFNWLAEFLAGEGARGCAFLNAAAELPDPDDPARQVARRHKTWMREFLAGLAGQAGLSEPERLGSQLLLLVDGASSRLVVEGGPDATREVCTQARQAATVLIEAATEGSR